MPLSPEDLVDVAGVLRHARYDGAIWSRNSEQLNINLMRLSAGARIPEHSNEELDVLLVIFEGISASCRSTMSPTSLRPASWWRCLTASGARLPA